MGILLENVAALNDALQMTQNLAEPVSRVSPRTGRFPWLFPSLNLDRSHSELATPWSPVEILYASSHDRICLFRRLWHHSWVIDPGDNSAERGRKH
jgi:hypothetical protein